MLINPLTPVSPMLPVTPVRPVAPPLDGEALLAMAAAAAAEVTDQLGRIAAASSEAMSSPAGASSAAATSSTVVAKPVAAEPELTPVVLQARAVGAAAAQAAQRQGGLAPLIADLVAARQTQTLPTPVRAALDQVLALRTPLDGAVTGADVKRALDRSGLFLEARLAAGVAPNDRPGAGRAADRSAPPPADLKAALLVFRQVVKTWADAAPAPSAQTLTAPSAAAPKALPGAASAVLTPTTTSAAAPPVAATGLAPPMPPSAPMSPSPALMTALQLPVFNAEIAPPAATAPSPAAPPAQQPPLGASGGPQLATATPQTPLAAPMDNAAPFTLVPGQPTPTATASMPAVTLLATPEAAETLAAFDIPHAPEPSAHALTTPPTSTAVRAEPGAAPPAESRLALALALDPPPLTAVREPPSGSRALEAGPHAAATPPPPYRDGPTSAQPAAAASLAANADAHTVAHHLLRETGAALARQELLQIASLPEPIPAAAPGRPVEDKGARWMFDVPFMTPQGAAVAQFEISRDGGGGGAEYEARTIAPVWRARFSLDVEPMGPVHAQIALSGERARVSLWAERPASMARLMAREPLLSTALREAELTPEVAFHAGAPQRAPAAPGKFVDQAS